MIKGIADNGYDTSIWNIQQKIYIIIEMLGKYIYSHSLIRVSINVSYSALFIDIAI